jgi:ATP-binding cassette subfamily C protein
LTGILFDTIIPSAAEGQVAQVAIILLTCALATAMFEITKGLALLRIETRMDTSLQSALWDRLLNLPATFFRQYTAGDLTNRSMGLNVIRQILSGVTLTTILAGIFSLLNFGLLFYYQWRLALVAAALAFFSLIVTGSASYVKVSYQGRVNDIQGKLSGLVLQFITGIAKLRVSGTEGRAFSIWATKFGEQKRLAVKAGRVDNLLACFNSIFPIMASMVIFAWVAFKSLGILSVGDFMAFNAAYIGFQYAMIQMGIAVAASLNVIPYYRRLTPILQALPESNANNSYPGELFGEIEVNHVNFRYDPHGPLILDDVSISARPGEFVALVGGSGSGKSTLLRLLMGFETPESGTIYYDGQDLATLDIQAVRHQTGVVLQNSQPMPGDLFKNIIGASNLLLADAWEAARMAGLEDDIRQMPMGMNTVISAGGGTISGGQRQRLLIARAIVRKPRLLYFDEATSALDNHTQAIVSRSLEGLQTTRIVIAHRLSTIIKADRIYVLENGRILESGTYEQLMDRKQQFYELAQRQIS